MQLRQAEQFQGEREAVAVDARDIAAPHQPVEHAVEFVGAAAEPLGDFGLGQAAVDAGQQLQNI